MAGHVLLLISGLALVAAVAMQWSDTSYAMRHGYVPRGWRKAQRLLRDDDPTTFWFLTQGRLLATIAGLMVWLVVVWDTFQ